MLQRFDQDGIEIVINTETGESFASINGYSRMAGKAKSTISERCAKVALKTAEIQTAGGLQGVRLINEKLITEWLPKDNPEMATKIMQLGVRGFLHTMAGFKISSTAIEPQVPQNYIEALEAHLKSEKEKLLLKAEVEEQKVLIAQHEDTILTQSTTIVKWHPLVKGYKQFMDTEGLISMNEASKMLPNTGHIRLMRVLKMLGILMSNNTPYQQYKKHFEVKVKVREHPSSDGTHKSDIVTLFTPNGFNSVLKLMIRKAGGEDTLFAYLEKPALLESKVLEEKKEQELAKSKTRDLIDEALEDSLF